MEQSKNLPPCCQPVKRPANRTGVLWGIAYGILPHTFCIAFIVFSLIGATAGAAFLGKFLAMPFFFPLLIALSLVFATISAALYLKRGKILSLEGIKASKKYLGILYGTTLGIGLVFAYVIFPWMVNAANSASKTHTQGSAAMAIQVAIPCPGHAALIIAELKKINGVGNIEFVNPDTFLINYDPSLASPQSIISLDIFKTYKATIK